VGARTTAGPGEAGTVPAVIGYLNGRTLAADLVLVGGVGYLVSCPQPLPVDTEVTLWVHTVVRETELSLYGFRSAAERDLFTAVMRAVGVGPKLALALLGLGAGRLLTALNAQDAGALARAPGVGLKKAQTLLGAITVPASVAAAVTAAAGTDAGGGAGAGGAAAAAAGDGLLQALVNLGHDRGAASRELDRVMAAAGADADPGLVLRRALSALARAA
jgi:Holliday junction DNA helicase RuvA